MSASLTRAAILAASLAATALPAAAGAQTPIERGDYLRQLDPRLRQLPHADGPERA
jgi:hypothetical protein